MMLFVYFVLFLYAINFILMDICLNRSRWLYLQLNNLTVSNYIRYFLMNIYPTDNK